jgi:hypothetical protein
VSLAPAAIPTPPKVSNIEIIVPISEPVPCRQVDVTESLENQGFIYEEPPRPIGMTKIGLTTWELSVMNDGVQ